ncbi:MAG TPA: hypothetical protein VIX86_03805 [Streptosporangiaceae bacterium]
MHRRAALLSVFSALSLALAVVFASGGAAAGAAQATSARASAVQSSTLGQSSPTFVGTAATGCASGCSLLAGPVNTPSTASLAAASAKPAAGSTKLSPAPRVMPPPSRPLAGLAHGAAARAPAAGPGVPTISCPGPGCDSISSSAGGAVGVKGLNAVDSATQSGNVNQLDIEPPDQGLCAGNGSVVETNNIGEILVFNTALQRQSSPIPLDTIMGLTAKNWSSGGDPSCYYDSSNGGHWFFTEIVSASPESANGPFSGCFVSGPGAVANACYEGIAVTDGSNPFGPYHVYYLHADYDPSEPGYPYLLNDFAKISVTRDAFLLFYDEFPLGTVAGLGGGFFNGAQEFAFNKAALESGLPVTRANGKPNPFFTVARENMGLLATPDGTCTGTAGFDCWAAAIPAQPPDPSQYDNSNGGSGFMLAALDFPGFAGVPTNGDNRIAVFDWTGLGNLNSPFCITCGRIRFGGQLFTGVQPYVQQETLTQYPSGVPSAQKTGPIPLANVSSANACLNGSTTPCPEGGLATNGDFMTQVSQAQGQIWGGTSTEINQTFSSETNPEPHQAVAYWVVGTRPFDRSGTFSLTSQGYVSAAHEDLTMPAIAAEGRSSQDRGNGGAIMTFTLSGNGGPTGADGGGYYPSTSYGRLTSTSSGLSGSVINIADPGQSPQDGFSEYQVAEFVTGFPVTRPRWGDYSWAIFVPGSGGKIYFANEYIQYPNCTGAAFTLTVGTCNGTRDGFANWGTSVNWVVP